MPEFLEAAMVICFGLSWPISIAKSYTARTTGGKSLLFTMLILVGYLFGIAAKLMGGKLTYVFFFYCLNFFMVGVDALLYFRNRKLDRAKLPN